MSNYIGISVSSFISKTAFSLHIEEDTKCLVHMYPFLTVASDFEYQYKIEVDLLVSTTSETVFAFSVAWTIKM